MALTFLETKDLTDHYVIDVEADSLSPTVIWCAVVKNLGTGEVWELIDKHSIFRFVEERPGAIWVGHNILSFDVPNVNRLCGTSIPLSRCIDTLVLSYLYNPALPKPANMPKGPEGGHGLKAWGYRLNFPKGDYNDWTRFSPEMLRYCRNDVELTARVYAALVAKLRQVGFSEKSCELEHQVQVVIAEQQRNGFYFDTEKAQRLQLHLRELERGLGEEIKSLFPPTLVQQGAYKYRVRADGTPFASYQRHLNEYEALEFNEAGDEYTTYAYEDFNIGSPKQRVEKLLSLGWEPTEFTDKGFPKVNEDTLNAFGDLIKNPQINAIADWLVYNGRANMIGTWLNCVAEDHRIHGTVFPCGAITRRMRHAKPNTANIPTNEAKYGPECRALWTVAPNLSRCLVGYDATALEGRMLANRVGKRETIDLLLRGDLHSLNAGGTGYSRGDSKTDFYAFLYGASNKKLGSHHGKGPSEGRRIRTVMMKNVPGLEELTRKCEWEQKSGFIQLLDGGYARCFSPHAALNTKLQGDGEMIMKQTMVYIRQYAAEAGLDHMKVGDIHDEGQHDVHERDARELGEIAIRALREAGETFNCKVPIDGAYSIGKDWSQTH